MFSNSLLSSILGSLSGLLLGTYFLINKLGYESGQIDTFSNVVMLLTSSGLCGLISLIVLRKEIKSIGTKGFVDLGINAIVMATALAIITISLGFTTAINSAVITVTALLVTALFSALWFNQSFTFTQVLALCIFLFGAYIAITGIEILKFSKGDLITAASLPFLALGNNLAKNLSAKYGSQVTAGTRFAVGLLILPLAFAIKGTNLFIQSSQGYALTAGFTYWLGIVFFYMAIKISGPTAALIFQLSATLIIVFTGNILLFDQSFSLIKFIGIAIIIFSLIAYSTASEKQTISDK